MKRIKISDVTMKQATRQFTLSFREKIELAKLLDRLGASVIELEGSQGSRSDSLRIKSIASAVNESIVAVPVTLHKENVESVWNALQEAKHPRLQVETALSSVQMEYLYHKKPQAMVEAIRETVSACKALCPDVEVLAGDATRSEPEFLKEALTAAVEAGASLITLCDTAGNMLPGEFASFVTDIMEQIPALKQVQVGVSCSDELSMADACSIAAIAAGAEEVKAAAYPVGTASLANVARILSARGDQLQGSSSVQVTQLSRILSQITRICQAEHSKTSPFVSGVQEQDLPCLTSHDDAQAVAKAVEHLGYDLSAEDQEKVFEAFQTIAAKKEQVSTRELDAIVASAAMQVPPVYTLDVYAIQAGNTTSATAHIRLKKDGQILEGVCIGDGPIDAAFLAMEQITGCHYELDDFQIQSVTEGREAMGQTVVKLLSDGRSYSGRGISTDIVDASIKAYLSALNKIVYEEVMA